MAKNNKNNNQPIDRTERVWPNKRKEVELVEFPFQTIETINLPRGTRQEELFGKDGHEGLKNRLIWGDNLLIMGSLLKEYAGKINLIYIDPPFATGDDFSFTVNIGDQAEITKEPSALEVKAYRDTWGKGMQSYLQMMYDRLVLMKELLADNGSIYVHLDWHVGHYVKLLMDEIFGKGSFGAEIIWKYSWGLHVDNAWNRKHDTILYYTKSNFDEGKRIFNGYDVMEKRGQEVLRRLATGVKSATMAADKSKVEDKTLKLSGDVWDIGVINAMAVERLNYPTQKPEEL